MVRFSVHLVSCQWRSAVTSLIANSKPFNAISCGKSSALQVTLVRFVGWQRGGVELLSAGFWENHDVTTHNCLDWVGASRSKRLTTVCPERRWCTRGEVYLADEMEIYILCHWWSELELEQKQLFYCHSWETRQVRVKLYKNASHG